MPRNSSGTYSLYTPGNPVVTSTVISSTWANNTLADLASALTDSLSRTGDGGMQAPLELDDGALGAPGLTWATETTSGLFRAGAGDFRFSVSATRVWSWSASGMVAGAATGGAKGAGTINAQGLYVNDVAVATTTAANPSASIGLTAVNGVATTFMRSDGAPALSQAISPTWSGTHTFSNPVLISAGSASNPGLTFTGDLNSGLFSLGADEIRMGTNGTARTIWGDAYFIGRVQFQGINGDATTPTYSFESDTNTGFYTPSAASDDVWMSLGGTGYPVGYRQIPRSTTATTFASGDVGKCVAVTAAINIPASVFSAGDAISVYNDSASAVNITISAGTLRLSGTATTGTRSLAARGFCTLWFNVGGATPDVIAVGDVA